jgi:predicted chitinase
MLISFSFLPGSANGSADSYEQAALSEIVGLDDYESPHGIYPISRDRRWHGGVHLTPKLVNEPVRAIADGTVVAYRVASDPLEGHDTGFVLLKHETETGHGRSITFYSLYMHLMSQADLKTKPALRRQLVPLMQTPTGAAESDGKTKICRKDILGYPGQMFGHRMIHFEIFMTDVDFKAYFGKTQLDNRAISATSSEEPWGDCYFVIPPCTFYSKPDKSSAEAGRSEQTLFARIRFDCGTKYTTVWCDQGEGKAPELITSAAGVPAPNYEYDLYKTATKLYPDCASAGYELLRFGRVIGPDKDRLPADKSANWQSVSFGAQQTGYVNLSDARIHKLSDADFPWFMGWTKVSEGAGALSDDGLCDSKVILDLLQEANSADAPKAGADQDRLAAYLRDHEDVRQKLRGLICEAPTEWDKSTNHKRFDRLTEVGEHYAGNAEGLKTFLEFVEGFQFWDKTGLPTKVWHFHPLQFISSFRKCGWLSERELGKIYSESIYAELGKTGKEYKEYYRNDINKVLNKYRFNTPVRMAHFFGQCAIESYYMMSVRETAIGIGQAIRTNHPSAMPELQGYLRSPPALRKDVEYLEYLEGKISLANTDPGDGVKFRGRGFKQITGRYNYSEYWVFRGWLARDSYDHSWFDKSKTKRGLGPVISDPERAGNDPYNVVDTAGFFCARYVIARVADGGVSVDVSRGITKIINSGASSESIAKRWLRTDESNKILGES